MAAVWGAGGVGGGAGTGVRDEDEMRAPPARTHSAPPTDRPPAEPDTPTASKGEQSDGEAYGPAVSRRDAPADA